MKRSEKVLFVLFAVVVGGIAVARAVQADIFWWIWR